MRILNDRLQFMRWERKLRLAERGRELLRERGIEGPLRPVPYKLALPIIEHASLEDNDELQDLWANLLTSAVDPKFEGLIRSAYVDIIKQLEVVDVHILDAVYERYRQWMDQRRGKRLCRVSITCLRASVQLSEMILRDSCPSVWPCTRTRLII
jgi:hypothetical protein